MIAAFALAVALATVPPVVRIMPDAVVDGDTFDGEVTRWFERIIIRVRVAGIDTPELHSSCARERDAAKAARDAVAELLLGPTSSSRTITLEGVQPDKYSGRYLATVKVDGVPLSDILIQRGLGRAYFGGTRQPWCPAVEP